TASPTSSYRWTGSKAQRARSDPARIRGFDHRAPVHLPEGEAVVLRERQALDLVAGHALERDEGPAADGGQHRLPERRFAAAVADDLGAFHGAVAIDDQARNHHDLRQPAR